MTLPGLAGAVEAVGELMKPPQIAYDPNPYGAKRTIPIDLGVMHSMGQRIYWPGGKYNGKDVKEGTYPAAAWLRAIKLSAHGLVSPKGVLVVTRSFDLVAWQAKGFNTRSVGLEVLVPGTFDARRYDLFLEALGLDPKRRPIDPAPADPYTPPQYRTAGFYWAAVVRQCPGLDRKIESHSTLSPSYKDDPGPLFNWSLFWHWFEAWSGYFETQPLPRL